MFKKIFEKFNIFNELIALLLVLAILTVQILSFGINSAFKSDDDFIEGEYALDEIIIKFFDKSQFPDKQKQYEDEVNKVLGNGFDLITDNVYVVKVEGMDKNPNAVLNRFKNSRFIEYVEPNYIVKPEISKDDPMYKTFLPVLEMLNAVDGWERESVKGITGATVAIVDSGVINNHPGLPIRYMHGYPIQRNCCLLQLARICPGYRHLSCFRCVIRSIRIPLRLKDPHLSRYPSALFLFCGML